MLSEMVERAMSTFGPDYNEKLDGKRVRGQMDEIRKYMLWTGWATLAEIESALGYPQSSISAQLRHLRKERFGGYRVDKRRRSQGTWEYRVQAPQRTGQMRMF